MQMIAGADFSRGRRGPFLSPGEIIVLAGLVGALLFLLFPGRDFENPAHLARPDELSIAYLNMLLRANPGDAEARLLLAQQQSALGHIEQARASLAPLVGRGDDIGTKAEVVALKLDRQHLAAMLPEDLDRPAFAEQVHASALKLLPRTKRIDDLSDLADFVLSMGDPRNAALTYQRLATMDVPHATAWLEKAARWTEAAGDPAGSAAIYAQAALGTSDAKTGARLAKASLLALLAASQGRASLPLAKKLVERYPRDLSVLEQGIRMAVGSGDLPTARRWGEQRIVAAGSSPEALREQVDLLIKGGDPEGALRVARQLAAKVGAGAPLQKQMAQLARWSGHGEESLEHWMWLARHGSDEGRKNALALAQAFGDNDKEVELLEMRFKQARREGAPTIPEFTGMRKGGKSKSAGKANPTKRQPRLAPGARVRPLEVGGLRVRGASAPRRLAVGKEPRPSESPRVNPGPDDAAPAVSISKTLKDKSRPGDFELSELIALADALEAKGLPDRAIAALDSLRFNFRERPEFWVRLAALYDNAGDPERALACYEQLARLKAMGLDDAIRQAELLWRLQRPDAALTRLIAMRGEATETAREYWELVADLAWRTENDVLAVEAYGILWKTQKRPEIAERLWRGYDDLGRQDAAIDFAEEAYLKLNQSGFLVNAVDMAIKAARWDRARQLFTRADGNEAAFDHEVHFWLQRADLAVHDSKPALAETYFRKALAIDKHAGDAHVEWLTLAVHIQDRSMAERALDDWGPEASESSDNWWLLSEAYSLLGDERRSNRFANLARNERARERASSGRALTPEEEIEDAVDRHDVATVAARLHTYGASLSLPARVSALRELKRDDEAWSLLEGAGLTEDKPLMESEDAASLVADVRDLREEYLDGAWVWGDGRQFGELEVRSVGVRFELRKRALVFGVEATASQLALPSTLATRPAALALGNDEQQVLMVAKLKESWGLSALRAGGVFLPDGYRPQASLAQDINNREDRFEVHVRAAFGDLADHSTLLRLDGLRDGIDGDAILRIGKVFEMGLDAGIARLSTRNREFLTNESGVRGELALRLPIGTAFVRPRIDAHRTWAPPLKGHVPPGLAGYLTGMEDPNDILGIQYDTAGIGLTVGSTHGDVGEGRGPHVSLRYHLDAWGGRLWPANKPSYALEAGLGLVFLRHQELSATGFYYSDLGSTAGERFAGATLNYTLRWFR